MDVADRKIAAVRPLTDPTSSNDSIQCPVSSLPPDVTNYDSNEQDIFKVVNSNRPSKLRAN